MIGGHLDIKGMLLPIERHLEARRRKGEDYSSTQDGSFVTIKLADSGKSDLDDCEMLTVDSPDAAAFNAASKRCLLLDACVRCHTWAQRESDRLTRSGWQIS